MERNRVLVEMCRSSYRDFTFLFLYYIKERANNKRLVLGHEIRQNKFTFRKNEEK